MPEFIPGLRLSDLFYHEAVQPILEAHFPGFAHSAALIGSGSEVLGFDTAMSSDHHWGPRVSLFVSDRDYEHYYQHIYEALANELPFTFRGYPTHFTEPNPDDHGVQLLEETTTRPINHRVEITTLKQFFKNAFDLEFGQPLDPADWLTIPSQRLRAFTAGAVYHDGIGLEAVRQQFKYYPHDVWLYMLAAGWTRIGQEEHFVGRTGYVGDDLGSQVIAARLVRDLMRLCFLMEKQYAPYPKWFGSAFAQLGCAERLTPILRWVMLAESWREREQSMSQAYEFVAEMHNRLGITEPLPAKVSNFWGRPFKVIHGEQFADAIKAVIRDETVKQIPVDIGSIDQFSDSTDLIEHTELRVRIKSLYRKD
ncbi:MAG: DUF4037 domain-containing protein [Anaerolineaceae bacterium]|nr:DUF4037 domain-containing protein [Anaerolineaceae bacterium]